MSNFVYRILLMSERLSIRHITGIINLTYKGGNIKQTITASEYFTSTLTFSLPKVKLHALYTEFGAQ